MRMLTTEAPQCRIVDTIHSTVCVCAYKFTGKERDTESGLDYFGARYYASSMGRWMSPDWSAKEEPVPYSKLDDPQTLNLYGYVGNNPLSRADADGHQEGGAEKDALVEGLNAERPEIRPITRRSRSSWLARESNHFDARPASSPNDPSWGLGRRCA